MIKWRFGTKKIYFDNKQEFRKEINRIECTNILHIEDAVPDWTTTQKCKQVYYETKIKY